MLRQTLQPIEALNQLPRRIFLDSSTLQALEKYGEFIWENVDPDGSDRIYTVPNGYDELDALRAIFFANKRASFEIALSARSLEEVADKKDPRYLGWAFEVLDHWETCLASYRESPFNGTGRTVSRRLNGPCFGYLSEKDRVLLQDALELECDAFLTLDRRLARNASHIAGQVGIRVLLPAEFWTTLSPWARLFV